MNKASGFTYIELLIVVTMAAILTVVSISSFKTLTNSSSVQGEISGFASMMQYARAEAMREGATVSICVSDNVSTGSPSCTGENTWNVGYIMFTDATGSGSYVSGTDTLLRKQQVFTTTDTLTASSAMTDFIFNRLGFISNIPASTYILMTGHAKTPASGSTNCELVTVTGELNSLSYGQSLDGVTCS